MSETQHTTAETPVQQPETKTEETPIADEMQAQAPATDLTKPIDPQEAAAITSETPAAEEQKDAAVVPEKKPVEPITEGQLALKGPGLLKSIIPSKKEFWLSDEAVSPQDLNSYMRGEKPEIAHAVVAWASQTGKGLLFFNKKGDTTKKQPSHVLALYDATDLKKESPHEIAFRLNGQEHVLKASSDSERDGWYLSIEKAIEMGKAQKEEIRESEGYKAEMEKLNKPAMTAAAIAAKRSQSQPKKSTEVDHADAQRKNSDLEDEEKKDKKSRSTSRGVLDRLKGKKEPEAKKEDKTAVEEPKADDHKPEEAAGVAAGAATVGAGAVALDHTADDKEDDKKPETVEPAAETTSEDKPKPVKRGSIFGKMQGWGSSIKSPSKEKDQKDAELKPEVPPKDDAAATEAPQLPEPTTTEPTVEPTITDSDVKPETSEKKDEVATPSKEKPTFLSSLSFGNKRNRSVSPSANTKEAPAKTEESAATDATPAPVEETPAPEAIAEDTAVEPLKATEPATTESPKTESTPNKRQSVFGNLGRRASKAFKGIQAPKKENAAPTTAAKKEETSEAPKDVVEPVQDGETKPAEAQPQQIGDVVPEAINIGKPESQPTPVAASA